jgi:hypothetical protein
MALSNNDCTTTWALCPICNVDREVKEWWFKNTPNTSLVLGRCGHVVKEVDVEFIIERKKH